MFITEGFRKLYRSLFGGPTKEIDEALREAEEGHQEGTLLFKKPEGYEEAAAEQPEAEQFEPQEQAEAPPEPEDPQEEEQPEEPQEVEQFTEEPLEASEEVEGPQEEEQPEETEEIEEAQKAVKHFDEKLGKPVTLLFKKPEPQESLEPVEEEFEEESKKLESGPNNRAGKVLWKKG